MAASGPSPAPTPKAPTPAPAASAAPKAATAAAAGSREVAPGVLELKGMTEFKPTEPIADFLAGHKEAAVNVRFGNLAQGQVVVKTPKKDQYQIRRQPLALTHPLFVMPDAVAGLNPSVVVYVEGGKLKGYIGLSAGEKIQELGPYLAKAPEMFGLFSSMIESLPKMANAIENGDLHLAIANVPIRLGSAFEAQFSIDVLNDTITFSGNAKIVIKGLANGDLELERGADGVIKGKVSLGLNLPKNLSGQFTVVWDGRAADGEGKLAYQGEKLSGDVVFHLMERSKAEQLEADAKAPEGQTPPVAAAKSKSPPAHVDYVIFGSGTLAFAFNDWLHGDAQVIVNPKGYVTVIGKITPQKEFILFPQKDYTKHLFKLEARATYGIPVVGDIFIFASIGMDAFAKVGPGVFHNIEVDGTYSTDPKQANDFTIKGTFNISAAAGVQLRAEAGAGLEILDHDIKVGAGLTGTAGIKAYAEATPIIGYREIIANGEDKKGEFFIRGETEIAAQPFLGLSGDVFVAIETPWWSPLSDHRWTWPLFDKEYPLGGSLGLAATVDYVFGSGQAPTLDLKPAEFSADKFMTDLYNDKAQSGPGKELEQKGKWQEKNSAGSQKPPKVPPKGNTPPGKLPATGPAKARAPGASKKGKPAELNDRTKDGKSVKQHQDEALKKGKKPSGKDVGKGAKAGDAKAAPDKTTHDEDLKKGLAALDAVTERYAKDGALKEEVVTGVKSVRRKFTVFKSIEVMDGGETWDYDYSASAVKRKKGPRKSKKNSYGSMKDPIPLAWPGPPTSKYPKIYFGGWLAPADRPMKQSVLKGLYTQGKKVGGSPVKEFLPEKSGQELPEETQRIGLGVTVNNHEIGKIKVGTVVGPLSKDGTPGGSKLGNIIKKYGFTSRGDGLQLDHVHETQLGGRDQNDRLGNLWPLESSVNASKGSRVKSAPVDYPKGTHTTIAALKSQIGPDKEFWFKVKSTE